MPKPTLSDYTPDQINAGLDRLAGDLRLVEAVTKLGRIAGQNRAYLFTPDEARALLAHLRRLELFSRGVTAAYDLAAAAMDEADPPTRPQYWDEIKQHLDTLAGRGVDMEGEEPAELLYDYFAGSISKRRAAHAVEYWRAYKEAGNK